MALTVPTSLLTLNIPHRGYCGPDEYCKRCRGQPRQAPLVPHLFPCRPETEAVSLARDVVNHAAVQRCYPHLVHDGTSLTAGSSVVLGDGAGRHAVLALKHIPPATSGAAQRAKLEAARQLAEHRAATFAAEALVGQPAAQGSLAVGIVSNVGGLEWLVPPPRQYLRQLGPLLGRPSNSQDSSRGRRGGGAVGRAARWVLRWAAAAAVAMGAVVLVGAAGKR